MIFTALDFGLGDDQERELSSDLEVVLEVLASEGNFMVLQCNTKTIVQVSSIFITQIQAKQVQVAEILHFQV